MKVNRKMPSEINIYTNIKIFENITYYIYRKSALNRESKYCKQKQKKMKSERRIIFNYQETPTNLLMILLPYDCNKY